MKSALFSVLGLMMVSGCSSYRYYDPQKPHRGKSQFFNNYDNSPKASFWRWQWERLTTSTPPEPPYKPEVLKTDTTFLRANQNEDTLTWIGHASFLLQMEGVNILMDPVFSERVSPVSFAGPKREVALPFSIEELPALDVVIISHSHYDHLDLPTLKKLHEQQGEKILFLVPLGDQRILQSVGIKNVKELDWWETEKVKDLTFTFTPSQHWSSRTPFDANETLWGGWYVQSSTKKFLYTGDTGYSKDFQDIHEKLGDVDVAVIPIGAYEPRWFMKQQHVNPEEAVQIHQDLHAKLSIAAHWGTFRLADEPMLAPSEDLTEALKNRNLESHSFRTMKHGEILRLNKDVKNAKVSN